MDKQRLQELAGIQLNEEDEKAEMKKAKEMYVAQTRQFRDALSKNHIATARSLAKRFDWSLDELSDQLWNWFHGKKIK